VAVNVKQRPSCKALFSLGSKSPQKFLALYQALQELPIDPDGRIETIDTDSRVNTQPFGHEETLLGARNRAIAAKVFRPGSIAIGIESGIFKIENGYEDRAIVVACLGDLEFVETSAGLALPMDIVEQARLLGFENTTFGQVLAASHPEVDHRDPHRFLTDGKTSRIDLLVPPLLTVLRQTLAFKPRRNLPQV